MLNQDMLTKPYVNQVKVYLENHLNYCHQKLSNRKTLVNPKYHLNEVNEKIAPAISVARVIEGFQKL